MEALVWPAAAWLTVFVVNLVPAFMPPTWAFLAFYSFGPIPSNELFIAAGLTRMRLTPITAAFF